MHAWKEYCQHLRSLECPHDILEGLINSIKWPEKATENTPILYVSGKMRGLPNSGFENFDRASELILKSGRAALSPAEMDRQMPLPDEWTDQQKTRAYMRRDWWALYSLMPERGDGIFLLDNWWKSTGAKAEAAISIWGGLKFYCGPTHAPNAFLMPEVQCLVS